VFTRSDRLFRLKSRLRPPKEAAKSVPAAPEESSRESADVRDDGGRCISDAPHGFAAPQTHHVTGQTLIVDGGETIS
jgi:hypothetical protein